MISLALIIAFSWSFYGEVFLSFLPYLIGIYSIYMLGLTAIFMLSRLELKKINSFWFNWLIVFFLFMGVFSFYFDLGASAVEPSSKSLKVVSSNLWYKNFEFPEVLEFFKKEDPDILMVAEYTDPQLQYFTDYLDSNYPYKSLYFDEITRTPYTGKAIYSKYPLKDKSLQKSEHLGLFLIKTAVIDQKEIDLVMVHTTAPVNTEYFDSRNKQLNFLQTDLVKELSDTKIVSGDFNVSPWSPSFLSMKHNLEKNELKKVSNNKFAFSWEYRPMGLFKSQIDHTFVGEDLNVTSYELKSVPGSDHKAQVFTVVWE